MSIFEVRVTLTTADITKAKETARLRAIIDDDTLPDKDRAEALEAVQIVREDLGFSLAWAILRDLERGLLDD
jgi:hypothetical protein